ncbi:MAG: potassium channel family protein [Thermodesulfobacteriota bacterium]
MTTILSATLGIILISFVLLDAFETVVFPRRVTRRLRLTRVFYRYSWLLWSSVITSAFSGRRRENLLSVYGPMSLPILMGFWAFVLISGFALLYWAFGPLARAAGASPGFLNALYFSATTFFTLGLGDTIPTTPPARLLTAMEAGVGFVFLAMIIGYLPALNQSFSRREVSISLLDARAGSPPSASEILRRNMSDHGTGPLEQLLHDWEYWAAELLESHLSYPVLAYFRSQHENQSWLSSLTALLDTAALVMVTLEGDCEHQAQRTFAIARHAVVDLALIFETPPEFQDSERLPPATLERLLTGLSASGLIFRKDGDADSRLAELRRMYEPYVIAISRYFNLTLPPWILKNTPIDNWQQSAWSPRKGSGRKVPAAGSGERHF